MAPVFAIFAILLHANLDWDWGPLRSVVASPRFHRWHHTTAERGGEKNFASTFPVLDLMFGTFYMPKNEVPDRYEAVETTEEGLRWFAWSHLPGEDGLTREDWQSYEDFAARGFAQGEAGALFGGVVAMAQV